MTTCKVISKYFLPESVMDESLQDFQEKKSCVIPRNTQKPQVKRKKPRKRLKGQKDIRTLVKKKNELLAFSNEFDQICKQSGLNLDSEQLQLAIALSKSLQNIESESSPLGTENSESEKALTARERKNKIKKTLQEYGFKVPDVKINVDKRKRRKKHYKLLVITDCERQQSISDKYSEVLLKNNYELNISNQQDNLLNEIYNIATNISYQDIKNDNVFRIKNLITKPSSKTFLLRDWSEIPGRPRSPEPVKVNKLFNVDYYDFTQDELDSILSSSIKSAQDTVRIKMESTNYINLSQQQNLSLKTGRQSIDGLQSKPSNRSMSPDMFADEPSDLQEEPVTRILSAPDAICQTNNKSAFMDLTECIAPAVLSLPTNTIRKSNDFMEITECIPNSISQKKLQNIGLTLEDRKNTCENKFLETMDLTQSSDSNDLPLVQVGGTQIETSLDGTIILDIDNINEISNEGTETAPEGFVILGSDNINEIANENTETSLKGTIIPDNDANDANSIKEILILNKYPKVATSKDINLSNDNNNTSVMRETGGVTDKENVSCTNSEFSNCDISNSSCEINNESQSTDENLTQSSRSSHGIADNLIAKTTELGRVNDVSIDYDELFDDMVSSINSANKSKFLQHTSNSNSYSEDDTESVKVNIEGLLDNKNKSIQENCHSEVDTEILKINIEGLLDNKTKYIQKKCNKTKEMRIDSKSKSDNSLSPRKETSVFQFNHDNFHFGGISILDELSNLEASRNSKIHINGSTSNLVSSGSCKDALQSELILNSNDIVNKEESNANNTPVKEILGTDKFEFKTPNNQEFIVKTNDVTPMIDYEQMSTPAMNKELEKYGIKPFKRKRAIQLLTYLYNQTHPIIQQYSEEELPSSSKKQKLNHNSFSSTQDCVSQKATQRDSLSVELNLEHKYSHSPIKLTPEKKSNSNDLSPIKNAHGPLSDKSTLGGKSNVVAMSTTKRMFENSQEKSISCNKSPKTSNLGCPSSNKVCKSPRRKSPIIGKENIYIETKQEPDIKEIYCSSDDWVFQNREKAKVHSCRVPLHIAFHNYVSCRKLLREAILCYEPVNIDIIHKDLVSYGYRYNPKDLLKFLDKRCITVKTMDNTRNKKL